jgi:invasion protein IalB
MARILTWSFAAALIVATPALSQKAPPPQTQPPSQAATSVSAEPKSTTAAYGDWVLRCQKAEALRVCEVVQSLALQGQTAPIAQIAVGHPAPNEKLRLTIVLPHNIAFSSTPRLAANQTEPGVALTWRRCLPMGCFADAPADDDLVKRLRGSTEKGRLIFNEASGREIVLPLSLTGLAQALDALPKV